MISVKLPFWLRVVVLVGAICLVAGAGLFTYRYFTGPTTLTVAAGSLDGEAVQAMSAIASRFAETNAPVRLKVIDTGSVVDAAKAFSAGNVDLAVVRGDVGDLSRAGAVAIVARSVVLIAAPSGSSIDSVTGLKGHTVGVVGGDVNQKVVAALTEEYNLDAAKVSFKDITPVDAGKAFKNKDVGALLVTIPLTEKYLSLFRSLVQPSAKATPVLVPIESAGAIAQTHGAYESFDVPKGTLRGAPPVPEDDLTTLRVSYYLVAQKKLDSDLIASLTQSFMNARRDLLRELPILAQITAANTDQDAYLPAHPGAAAFYNGNVQSFLDKYSNAIFLTPMALGALATIAAAAWKFLGLGKEAKEGVLDSLYMLARRIRSADNDAALSEIEDQLDTILKAQLAKTAAGDEDAIDAGTLNLAAHRLENLIHYRRAALAMRPERAPAA
ncbi:C4-dicarboxylate ABC transporter substrate-binding protein [Bradyrhizobium centrolobii]|uniref:C4-dicarboxylate ABC transporter substrate-binding protein n=1 Tax=Bradyrhizobium centrolobii TaxID=1505087 RepID=A0A176YD10_9BRAD|nr:TAXI family TRAP transporter solute-binding subunit [Bradyrhizobium centrolobii]OAF02972.1 C4-dicarboxylate ABC transporter substrate-binding protein [Bradyrhizobium centrolobii]